jgi:hypothetical protein
VLYLLKIVSIVVLGAWSLLRGAEEALGIWVRRSSRSRDLSGMSWA